LLQGMGTLLGMVRVPQWTLACFEDCAAVPATVCPRVMHRWPSDVPVIYLYAGAFRLVCFVRARLAWSEAGRVPERSRVSAGNDSSKCSFQCFCNCCCPPWMMSLLRCYDRMLLCRVSKLAGSCIIISCERGRVLLV
jgi:hypothetical protein